jgi:hypothetical protein
MEEEMEREYSDVNRNSILSIKNVRVDTEIYAANMNYLSTFSNMLVKLLGSVKDIVYLFLDKNDTLKLYRFQR